ncbi:MAG: phosphohistidine phosphatase SixA [Thermodesulfobacteriota bacterium]|nr:phosphohistidine phosphatase SixA [Thermodesulfobacteriota bacterium]
MSLYLVQHGKSLSKEEDPEQGLSEAGETETARIAEVARVYGVEVAVIHHSTKKRAGQTARRFADALSPPGGCDEISGLKAMDDVKAMAETLNPGDNRMLVGHLPFMGRLVSWLITGDTEKPVFAFQNSGVVCLDKTEDGHWIIRWTLMPHIS